MRRRLTCRRLRSASAAAPATRSTAWCRSPCSNTLSNTDFIRRHRQDAARWTRHLRHRQAGCMAKTEKRRITSRLPKQIDIAVHAAEDKKAEHLVVLDLRKASGFTDYFLIASGTNPRQVRAIADSVVESLGAAGVKP